MNIRDGIPTMQEYKNLVNSEEFKNIEDYSDKFVNKTKHLLAKYKNRWVLDPLHQWSRQWEYPYVITRLVEDSRKNKSLKILDLGSGITFLPFYLEETLPQDAKVICCDYDLSITSSFKAVSNKMNSGLNLDVEDMRSLSYPSASFDIAYSVSVLEHTDNYEKVVKSIYRVLKPGGKLIITFDISIDGYDDIPLAKAYELLKVIESVFKNFHAPNIDEIKKDVSRDEIVTSSTIAKMDKKLTPWKLPIINSLKTLVKHKKLGRLYKNLTFYCLTVEKTR